MGVKKIIGNLEVEGGLKVTKAPVDDTDVVRLQDLADAVGGIDLNIENGEATDSIVQKYSGEVDDTHYCNTNTGEGAAVLGEANNNSGKRALLSGKLNLNARDDEKGDNSHGGNSGTGAQNIIGGLQNNVYNTNNAVVSGSRNNVINANQTAVIGLGNEVENSHCSAVFGYDNTAADDYVFVAGQGNTATNTGAIVAGRNSESTGVASVALGDNNKAVGNNAIAIGSGNYANKNNAVAVGSGCSADTSGIALGNSAKTTGGYGVSIGQGTQTYFMQTALGNYNARNDNAVLLVGNGTSSNDRKNALEILKDGGVKGGRQTTASDNSLTLVTKGYIDTKPISTVDSDFFNSLY